MSTNTKKKIIVVLSVLLFILVGGIAGANLYVDSLLNKMNKQDKLTDKDTGVKEETKKESKDQKVVNIALLGIDNDGEGTTHRADAMKIISLDLDDKTVTISSVQRDNLVYIPGSVNRYDKLNHSYAYGGAQLLLNTFNYNFDLDMTQYVAFDFDAVYQVVDMVGGVNITLSDLEAVCIGIQSGGGTYTLNGQQALNYVRLRESDNDYVRMQRQNNVIRAILSTMIGKGIPELMNSVQQILPLIETNIPNSDIKKYVTSMVGFSMDNLKQYQMPENGYGDVLQSVYLYGYGPHYILRDFSGMVEQLHRNIYNNNYKASEQVERIENEILTNYYTGQ